MLTKTKLIILLLLISFIGIGQGRYSFAVTPSGISAFTAWFMDNDATDNQGNIDLTATNITYGTTTPPQGSHFADMRGGTEYFTMQSVVDLGTSWTLMGWLDTGVSGTKTIFGGFTGNDGVSMYADIDGGILELKTGDGGSTTSATATGLSIDDQAWHHYAAICNEGVITLCLDGVDVTTTSGTEAGYDNTITFRIGRELNDAFRSFADHDDTRIYLSALTVQQVLDIKENP